MILGIKVLCFLCVVFYAASSQVTATHFELIGNSSSMESFDRVREASEECTLTSFELQYVETRRSTVVNYLKSCVKLTWLSMYFVKWKHEETNVDPYEKVFLPKLTGFQYMESTCNLLSSEDIEFVAIFRRSDENMSPLSEILNIYYEIDLKFCDGGRLHLKLGRLEVTSLQKISFWEKLYKIMWRFDEISAVDCRFDAKWFNVTIVEHLTLKRNEIKNGNLAQILKSAQHLKYLGIESLKDEAIDVAILPSKTIVSIQSKFVSFRWNSNYPKEDLFPALKTLVVVHGDLNLKLFKNSPKLTDLRIANTKLFNSTFEDIGTFFKSLELLFISCQHFDEVCPSLLLDSLPMDNLDKLLLENMEVSFRVFQNFSNLSGLGLFRCKFPTYLLDNLFNYTGRFGLDIEDAIEGAMLPKMLASSAEQLTVNIPNTASTYMLLLLGKRISSFTNISLSPGILKPMQYVNLFRGRGGNFSVEFRDSEEEIKYKKARITKLLQTLGLNEILITSNLLEVVYYCYTIIVYATCAIGTVCNGISVCVLSRKSMRNTTSRLLLSLAFCDTLYLLTSAYMVEEFKNLFRYTIKRSALNGHVVYPVNKTMYTASIYMTVLITVERFVAVCYPLRVSSIFIDRRTVCFIFLIYGFATIINIPRWFEFFKWDYEASSPIWSSSFPRQLHRYPQYELGYQKILWSVFVYAVPFTSISILNILIVLEVNRAAAMRKSRVARQMTNVDNSLTKMLLTIVIVFFACNSVSAALNWILMSLGVEPEVSETFACLPIIVNSSVNFFLYYLMGSKFRNELRKMLGAAQKCIMKK